MMELLSPTADAALADVDFVLCDMDDTLTWEGRLPAVAYSALEELEDSGFRCVVVTGRPAGWCDMIARMLPVAGVVGENGAFYFSYDRGQSRMRMAYQRDAVQRSADRARLDELFVQAQLAFPDIRLAGDQAYRVSDIAIDFCEDVTPLPRTTIDTLIDQFTAAGATVKESSIHLNIWIGDFDKLGMTRRLFADVFGIEGDTDLRARIIYAGDSPNDEPMFRFFDKSAGVANVAAFQDRMTTLPRWITAQPGGYGFAEIAERLLANRRS